MPGDESKARKMKRPRNEFQQGLRDAQWFVWFAVYSLPAVVIAVLLAWVIEGRVPNPPSPFTWGLVVAGAAASLFLAGMRDGPGGRLGHTVWMLVIYTAILLLCREALRSPNRRAEKSLRWGGYVVNLSCIAEDPMEESSTPWETWPGRGGFRWDWREIHPHGTA